MKIKFSQTPHPPWLALPMPGASRQAQGPAFGRIVETTQKPKGRPWDLEETPSPSPGPRGLWTGARGSQGAVARRDGPQQPTPNTRHPRSGFCFLVYQNTTVKGEGGFYLI